MLRNKILEGLKPCTIYCFLNFGNTILKKYKKNGSENETERNSFNNWNEESYLFSICKNNPVFLS